LLAAMTSTLHSEEEYAAAPRVEYLGRALAAVQALGADGRAALEQEMDEGVRTKCRADAQTPAIACQVELARSVCAGRGDECLLAADVISTNRRSENELVDEATRVRILGESADFRVGLRAELDARYAALAAELALTSGADLAVRIDRLCSHREADPSWQRCAAALIWYIGGHP
jgi:hypothetical protein